MKKFLRTFALRFTHRSNVELYSPFKLFFVFQNLLIGMLFMFNQIYPTGVLVFDALNETIMHPWGATVWGGILVLCFIGHCFQTYFRGVTIGPYVGMAAWMMWLLATLSFVRDGLLFAILGTASPQLFFWAWYYFRTKHYKREFDADSVPHID